MFAVPPIKTSFYRGDENFLEYVKDIEYAKKDYGNNTVEKFANYNSADTYILNQPIFENLKKFIQEKVDEYVIEVFASNQKLRLTQSWVNENKTNTLHKMHYHANSFLSGVFFFDAHPSKLQLFDPGVQEHVGLSDKQAFNEFNSSVFNMHVRKNVLAIFPSYVSHCVDLNQIEKTRYSLSFNTFPIGDLGSIESLTHVSM